MRAMYSVTLRRGQLAAFAGLGALRHLDFELFRVHEIVGSDAESAGSTCLILFAAAGSKR